MPEGHVLEFTGVTKRFGSVTAVDGLTARVEPGVVTGFLGPNGAGKTTSLRILLGLIGATSGSATIGGKHYHELDNPLQTVGAALEASSFHPGRTAANHLKVYAQASGIVPARIDEALGLVGLSDVAGRKVGGFSLGMRQRLGLAFTLLGDPGVLVLDEPSNGLDPEGIKWIRGFLRELAAQGRTVLVSSHMLAEIQQQADALIIISRGRLVFQGPLYALTEADEHSTLVDAPDREALTAALAARDIEFKVLRSGLSVVGADPAAIGATAAAAGVALSTLQRRGPALEEVFLDLVNGVRVHASAGAVPGGVAAGVVDAGVVTPEAPAEPDVAEAPGEPAVGDAPESSENLANPEAPVTLAVAEDVDGAGVDESHGAQSDGDEPDDDEPDDDESESSPADLPATWDADHPMTDADVEADQFFSRYDPPAADDAPEPTSDPPAADDAPEPTSDPQDADAETAPEPDATPAPEDASQPDDAPAPEESEDQR